MNINKFKTMRWITIRTTRLAAPAKHHHNTIISIEAHSANIVGMSRSCLEYDDTIFELINCCISWAATNRSTFEIS